MPSRAGIHPPGRVIPVSAGAWSTAGTRLGVMVGWGVVVVLAGAEGRPAIWGPWQAGADGVIEGAVLGGAVSFVHRPTGRRSAGVVVAFEEREGETWVAVRYR